MSINFRDWAMGKISELSAIALCTVVSSSSVLATPTKPVDPTTQQMIGRWEGILIRNGETQPIIIRFTPTGKAILVVSDLRKGGVALSADYTIDATQKPMHLDLKGRTFTTPLLTLAELVDPRTLKLQLNDAKHVGTRPRTFEEVVQLQKVSDTAVLALTPHQLASLEQSKDGEGKFVIAALLRSALIHTIETQKLPTTLAAIGLSNASTQNYDFQLSTTQNSLTLIARARKAGFRSYIGAVLPHTLLKDQGEQRDSGFVAICQSFRPSQMAPSIRIVPNFMQSRSAPFVCGSGSELIGL